jgi:hypothetical protein
MRRRRHVAPATRARAALLVLLAGIVAGLHVAPPSTAVLSSDAGSAGSGPVLDAPTASGSFGEPLVFESAFRSPGEPLRVELLAAVGNEPSSRVRLAQVRHEGADRYRASLVDASHLVPNTRVRYRFRVVTSSGSTLGPEAEHLVTDERLEWRSLEGERLTLLWHRGSDDFARRALEIGEAAIDEAADLLGVSDVEPVTFIVYADAEAFQQALGPGTREQVGGQANARIRTMFGLIRPAQVNSSWVEELVRHELTHLVFDDAVANPYHDPPRWLNEGLAVYLSAGFSRGDRAQVDAAARAGSLIPLDGLTGNFPTTPRRFSLAYAISVSAVDFFVRTHGQERLIALITSYADGVSDDEAFRRATGAGFADFDDAWMASLGVERPAPRGPRPAPPARVPEEWRTEATPLLP